MRKVFCLLSMIFVSCNQTNNTKEFLKNKNWYTYSLKQDSVNNYQEYFFGKKNIFRFDSNHSFLSPLNYKINNDSLFVIYSKDNFNPPKKNNIKEFIGIISIIDNSSFYLINKDSLIFNEIFLFKNKLMSNYIQDSEESKIIYKNKVEEYYEFVNKRRDNFLSNKR